MTLTEPQGPTHSPAAPARILYRWNPACGRPGGVIHERDGQLVAHIDDATEDGVHTDGSLYNPWRVAALALLDERDR